MQHSPPPRWRLAAGTLLSSILVACSGGGGSAASGGERDGGDGGKRTFESTILEAPCPIRHGGFGFSTVPLDFDGDGILDIGIGAPGESRVYVALGVGNNEYGPMLSFDESGPAACAFPGGVSIRFGEALAKADLDGDGDDELIVGAPDMSVNGILEAGAVFIIGLPTQGGSAPLQINADVPARGNFGAELLAADFDQDGQVDLAIGAPQALDGGMTAGSVTVVYSAGTVGEYQVHFPNPAPAENGRFGSHFAVDDGNADGFPELFICAVGNTDSNGIELSGQAYGYWGPIDPEGTFVLDDSLSLPADFPRFGMHITAADGVVVVGAPRKDVGSLADSGRSYLWRAPSYASVRRFQHPTALPFDLFGYRVQLADLIGDETIDLCVVSLPAHDDANPNRPAVYIYDGAIDDPNPYRLRALTDSGSHFAVGFSTADLVNGGRDELILGDSRYDRDGLGDSDDSGRVVIYY
ncbi:MAG: hypothetical protein ACI8QC_004418 [Planctomycetota bacterium]|jgi:hypothetical protein